MRDAGYRTTEEIDEWKARDPIARLRDHLLRDALATEAELGAVDTAVAALIVEAVEFARRAPAGPGDRDGARLQRGIGARCAS
jgi:TPP-dependent pyruvate/acetoin dehydrogenase alpha subunit